MRFSIFLFFIVSTMFVTGCGAAAAGQPPARVEPAAASRCAIPRTVVVGIDRSGSYALTGGGIEAVARLLERAGCPADIWYLRYIEEDSFRASAAIHTVAFKAMPPQPTAPANPLAQRSREEGLRAWDAIRRTFLKERADAAALLRSLTPSTATATDVSGFFLKAGELYSRAPKTSEHVIVVVSDLQHNVARDGDFQIPGAHVIALVFQADDPIESQALRAYWQERLTRAGAASVRFFDPSEPVDHVLDAPATALTR